MEAKRRPVLINLWKIRIAKKYFAVLVFHNNALPAGHIPDPLRFFNRRIPGLHPFLVIRRTAAPISLEQLDKNRRRRNRFPRSRKRILGHRQKQPLLLVSWRRPHIEAANTEAVVLAREI